MTAGMTRRSKTLLLAAVLLAFLAQGAEARTLPAPRVSSPAANATVQSLPAFTWSKVSGAAQYEFQLAADSGFRSIVLGSGFAKGTFRTTNTAATIEESIPNGTYYWRVRGITKRDKVGRWTGTRTLVKAWTAAPDLLTADALAVAWPSQPLVLRWSPVGYATKYLVSIARDDALGSIIFTGGRAVETTATTFALPDSLAPGRYYWAITPIDARGHVGTRSRVTSFDWSWPSGTTTRVNDLDPSAEVFDPQFSWDPVPGAARYEVEVNSSQDFATGSKWCCDEPTTGRSLSPTKPLANNRYYWRVRAVDPSGNRGQWNLGPQFDKGYDATVPSVKNLKLRDNTYAELATGTATNSPVVTWDPVPGAVTYEVQIAPYSSFCDWASPNTVRHEAVIPAWTPGYDAPHFGSSAYPDTDSPDGPSGGNGQWCFRVNAHTADDARGDVVLGDWTQLGGSAQPSFTALDQPSSGSPSALSSSDYLAPGPTERVTRTPLFRWNRVPNAFGYYVIVARDANFTKIADVGYTRIPAYAPTTLLNDETTNYYWYVVPTNSAFSYSDAPENHLNDPAFRHQFDKASIPPAPLVPVNNADVTSQPTFSWTSAEGAKEYRLQVSSDPTFGNPIDDVVTTSIAYTSSNTYPADTVLYWRVRANDAQDQGLNWSSPATFQRRLAVPVPDAGPSGPTMAIPVLSWAPVEGAIAYDVRVEQADGETKDFTVNSTSFTPTVWYGVGIWRWRVRARFPTRGGGAATSAYSLLQTVVRALGAPTGVTAKRTKSRLLISWNPDPIAKRYTVDFSTTNGFAATFGGTSTDHTSWAPDLGADALKKGGTIYWRVATLDEGNNRGAYATGEFRIPRLMQIEAGGFIAARKAGTLKITVRGASGGRIKKARVTVTGGGLKSSSRRTSKRGVATFRIRPRKRGKLTIKASKSGYQTTKISYRVV